MEIAGYRSWLTKQAEHLGTNQSIPQLLVVVDFRWTCHISNKTHQARTWDPIPSPRNHADAPQIRLAKLKEVNAARKAVELFDADGELVLKAGPCRAQKVVTVVVRWWL